MFRLSAIKISLAASALLLCAGFAQAQTTTEPVSPLAALPTSVNIAYTLPSTAGNAVPVNLSISAGSDAFVVDPTTVPIWLTLSASSGTATTTPVAINFSPSSAAAQLGGGVYSQTVHVRVSGFQDLQIPVTLSVNEPGSTLSVTTAPAEVSSTVPLTWVYGSTTYPTATISVFSTDQPVAFTATATVTSPAAPANWLQLNAGSGIAYNFGTPLTVSILKDVLQNATVGNVLTATVTISYGSTPTTITVPVSITVLEPYATLSSTAPLYPAAAPPQTSGSLQVVVTGTGFISGGSFPTTVSIAYGTVTVPVALVGLTSKTGNQVGAVTVVNPTTMILSIPFEDGSSTPVSILGTPQAITISITNGVTINSVLETPVTTSLNITNSPIINAVTDAASMAEPNPGKLPTFAPYELVTLFGANFCGAAPGCSGTPVVNTVGAESRYLGTVTAGAGTVTVAFNNQSGALIADAYLLFVSDTQINALVPSTAVASTTLTGLQIVVTNNGNSSAPFLATPVAAHPGIFTTAASGQGPGAILLSSNYSVVSSTSTPANPAVVGNTVLVYLTGMGVPNSTSASITATATSKAPVFPTACFLTADYVSGENLTNPATADGAVLVPTVWGTGNLPPCFATKSYVTATIGGIAATVSYAGWVADSVTGLYQVNLVVPKATTSTTPVDLPIVLTVGTGTSAVQTQPGVTISVQN
jgi:uncharacterized protein (TIGR03437 family)